MTFDWVGHPWHRTLPSVVEIERVEKPPGCHYSEFVLDAMRKCRDGIQRKLEVGIADFEGGQKRKDCNLLRDWLDW